MTTQPTILIREHNGQDVMSSDALSLLFGIPADDITNHINDRLNGRVQSMIDFPQTWLQAGRRRVSEAAAATGDRELLSVLQYWAERDRDAVIVFIDGDEVTR